MLTARHHIGNMGRVEFSSKLYNPKSLRCNIYVCLLALVVKVEKNRTATLQKAIA